MIMIRKFVSFCFVSFYLGVTLFTASSALGAGPIDCGISNCSGGNGMSEADAEAVLQFFQNLSGAEARRRGRESRQAAVAIQENEAKFRRLEAERIEKENKTGIAEFLNEGGILQVTLNRNVVVPEGATQLTSSGCNLSVGTSTGGGILANGRVFNITALDGESFIVTGDSIVQSVTIKRTPFDQSLTDWGAGSAFGNGQGSVGDLRRYCKNFGIKLIEATAENKFNNANVLN